MDYCTQTIITTSDTRSEHRNQKKRQQIAANYVPLQGQSYTVHNWFMEGRLGQTCKKRFNITYVVSITEFICKDCIEMKSRRLALTLFSEGIPRTYIRERCEP
jgi:hypothetical protein